MNELLRMVPAKWYRLYVIWALLFSVAVVAGWGVTRFVPGFAGYQHTFGLTNITAAVAGAVIAYCSTLYWMIESKNPLAAVFGASMLYSLLMLLGLVATRNLMGNWVYIGGTLATTFFSGMYGTPILLGSILFWGTYVLFNGQVEKLITPQSWTLLAGIFVVSGMGFWFWRRRLIVDAADKQLSQLTGILQSKEEQAAILIQSIADGVIVTNTEGKISLMNRAAANMTGWTIDEATGINVEQVFKVAKENGAEIPQEEYPFTAVLVHRAFFNQILQLTARNGKKEVISLVISPVVTQKGEVFGAVAVLRDVSEERAAEAQRGEFISTASHEMRTPVAAIEGYLALALNDKVSTIDSRARSYLEKAHASTQHLGQLFQDLLTSAKAEDGRLSNHPVAVEMGSFLEQLVDDLRFGAQKKGLSTDFAIGSSDAIDATKSSPDSIKMVKPLYYVYVDPDRLREVITNLFDNAVKYTDQGKVSIGLTGNDDVVQMYIRDTGAGIPAEDVPHLFQKFYRVDNSATRTIGGTGLGLFIARKIIELYQGRIWVESELGKGSTFFINLPRLTAQKAQELQTAAAAVAPAAPASTKPTA